MAAKITTAKNPCRGLFPRRAFGFSDRPTYDRESTRELREARHEDLLCPSKLRANSPFFRTTASPPLSRQVRACRESDWDRGQEMLRQMQSCVPHAYLRSRHSELRSRFFERRRREEIDSSLPRQLGSDLKQVHASAGQDCCRKKLRRLR